MSRHPIIVCLDEAHRMCPTSWQLLDSITYECELIAFILIVKSDERDRLMITPESVPAFESVWQSMTSTKDFNVRVIDLPMLSPEQIGELIISNAKEYRDSYTMEVDAMTKIIDPERTIKSPEASKMWQELLIKKNQLKYVMEEIDGRILKLIAHKSISNPL